MNAAFMITRNGEWTSLLAAVARYVPAAMALLGDCDLMRPIDVEFAPIFAAGMEGAYLQGNHDMDRLECRDNLVGHHPRACCHAQFRSHDHRNLMIRPIRPPIRAGCPTSLELPTASTSQTKNVSSWVPWNYGCLKGPVLLKIRGPRLPR